jgi:hypothetical protein
MSAATTFEWDGGTVSGAWHHPAGGADYLILAHGAGGTMNTPSLRAYAEGIAARGLGAVRFNFGYAEAGKKAPDRAPKLEACFRAVLDAVATHADRVFLGGRSMGGRIGSHLAAAGAAGAEAADVAGLVFLAYPLHPVGKPERIRDEHLYRVEAPMLFLQGTRDPFATPDLLRATIDKLGARATLHPVEGGDHSHRVKGRKEADIVAELVEATMSWLP